MRRVYFVTDWTKCGQGRETTGVVKRNLRDTIHRLKKTGRLSDYHIYAMPLKLYNSFTTPPYVWGFFTYGERIL